MLRVRREWLWVVMLAWISVVWCEDLQVGTGGAPAQYQATTVPPMPRALFQAPTRAGHAAPAARGKKRQQAPPKPSAWLKAERARKRQVEIERRKDGAEIRRKTHIYSQGKLRMAAAAEQTAVRVQKVKKHVFMVEQKRKQELKHQASIQRQQQADREARLRRRHRQEKKVKVVHARSHRMAKRKQAEAVHDKLKVAAGAHARQTKLQRLKHKESKEKVSLLKHCPQTANVHACQQKLKFHAEKSNKLEAKILNEIKQIKLQKKQSVAVERFRKSGLRHVWGGDTTQIKGKRTQHHAVHQLGITAGKASAAQTKGKSLHALRPHVVPKVRLGMAKGKRRGRRGRSRRRKSRKLRKRKRTRKPRRKARVGKRKRKTVKVRGGKGRHAPKAVKARGGKGHHVPKTVKARGGKGHHVPKAVKARGGKGHHVPVTAGTKVRGGKGRRGAPLAPAPAPVPSPKAKGKLIAKKSAKREATLSRAGLFQRAVNTFEQKMAKMSKKKGKQYRETKARYNKAKARLQGFLNKNPTLDKAKVEKKAVQQTVAYKRSTRKLPALQRAKNNAEVALNRARMDLIRAAEPAKVAAAAAKVFTAMVKHRVAMEDCHGKCRNEFKATRSQRGVLNKERGTNFSKGTKAAKMQKAISGWARRPEVFRRLPRQLKRMVKTGKWDPRHAEKYVENLSVEYYEKFGNLPTSRQLRRHVNGVRKSGVRKRKKKWKVVIGSGTEEDKERKRDEGQKRARNDVIAAFNHRDRRRKLGRKLTVSEIEQKRFDAKVNRFLKRHCGMGKSWIAQTGTQEFRALASKGSRGKLIAVHEVLLETMCNTYRCTDSVVDCEPFDFTGGAKALLWASRAAGTASDCTKTGALSKSKTRASGMDKKFSQNNRSFNAAKITDHARLRKLANCHKVTNAPPGLAEAKLERSAPKGWNWDGCPEPISGPWNSAACGAEFAMRMAYHRQGSCWQASVRMQGFLTKGAGTPACYVKMSRWLEVAKRKVYVRGKSHPKISEVEKSPTACRLKTFKWGHLGGLPPKGKRCQHSKRKAIEVQHTVAQKKKLANARVKVTVTANAKVKKKMTQISKKSSRTPVLTRGSLKRAQNKLVRKEAHEKNIAKRRAHAIKALRRKINKLRGRERKQKSRAKAVSKAVANARKRVSAAAATREQRAKKAKAAKAKAKLSTLKQTLKTEQKKLKKAIKQRPIKNVGKVQLKKAKATAKIAKQRLKKATRAKTNARKKLKVGKAKAKAKLRKAKVKAERAKLVFRKAFAKRKGKKNIARRGKKKGKRKSGRKGKKKVGRRGRKRTLKAKEAKGKKKVGRRGRKRTLKAKEAKGKKKVGRRGRKRTLKAKKAKGKKKVGRRGRKRTLKAKKAKGKKKVGRRGRKRTLKAKKAKGKKKVGRRGRKRTLKAKKAKGKKKVGRRGRMAKTLKGRKKKVDSSRSRRAKRKVMMKKKRISRKRLRKAKKARKAAKMQAGKRKGKHKRRLSKARAKAKLAKRRFTKAKTAVEKAHAKLMRGKKRKGKAMAKIKASKRRVMKAKGAVERAQKGKLKRKSKSRATKKATAKATKKLGQKAKKKGKAREKFAARKVKKVKKKLARAKSTSKLANRRLIKAQALRKKARKALRQSGKPVPAELRKGGMAKTKTRIRKAGRVVRKLKRKIHKAKTKGVVEGKATKTKEAKRALAKTNELAKELTLSKQTLRKLKQSYRKHRLESKTLKKLIHAVKKRSQASKMLDKAAKKSTKTTPVPTLAPLVHLVALNRKVESDIRVHKAGHPRQAKRIKTQQQLFGHKWQNEHSAMSLSALVALKRSIEAEIAAHPDSKGPLPTKNLKNLSRFMSPDPRAAYAKMSLADLHKVTMKLDADIERETASQASPTKAPMKRVRKNA